VARDGAKSLLYGTTNAGGSSNVGVVFEVTGVRTATMTSLTSSTNPSAYGQAVTFTAVVTPSSARLQMEKPSGLRKVPRYWERGP
jgi:uncharacterized repeat protein (TIGR03803 family)